MLKAMYGVAWVKSGLVDGMFDGKRWDDTSVFYRVGTEYRYKGTWWDLYIVKAILHPRRPLSWRELGKYAHAPTYIHAVRGMDFGRFPGGRQTDRPQRESLVSAP